MRTALTLTLLALSLPVHVEEKLVFAPTEGTVLTKRIELDLELELVSMKIIEVLGGRERDWGDRWNDMAGAGFEFVLRRRLTSVDEYGPVAQGRPLSLQRTLEELNASRYLSTGPYGVAYDRTGSGELEGGAVSFTWDEEDEHWSIRAEAGCKDWDLEGLVEDTDARAFLPAQRVSVGEAWDVPTEAFQDLLQTGGFRFTTRDGEDAGHPAALALARALEGEPEAWLRSVDEVHGRRLAQLRLEGRLAAEVDSEAGGGSSYRVEIEVDADSTLAWALDVGHMHSLDLRAEVSLWEEEEAGDYGSIRYERLWRGELRCTVTVDC